MPKRIRSMKRLVVEVNDELYFLVKKITTTYNITQSNLLRWAIKKMIVRLSEKIIETKKEEK